MTRERQSGSRLYVPSERGKTLQKRRLCRTDGGARRRHRTVARRRVHRAAVAGMRSASSRHFTGQLPARESLMKTDLQIQSDVVAELRWDPSILAAEIGVAVKAGVATLSG